MSSSPPAGRSFWPVGEAAQADYEMLREHVLTLGALPDSLVTARFARRGLAGLIAWPAAEPVFRAELVGGARPPWSPHADPRLDALAEVFALLLDVEHGSGRDHGAAAVGERGGWAR